MAKIINDLPALYYYTKLAKQSIKKISCRRKIDGMQLIAFGKRNKRRMKLMSSSIQDDGHLLIESKETNTDRVNKVTSKSTSKACHSCGGTYPHERQCLVKGKQCRKCQKLNYFARVCRGTIQRQTIAFQHETERQTTVKSTERSSKWRGQFWQQISIHSF